LLDTHILLWWLGKKAALSHQETEIISNPAHLVFVSSASVWEIAMKESMGKLTLPGSFYSRLAEQPLEKLPITAEHARQTAQLPLHHKDPFDRMLIAQARCERITLISRDRQMAKYEVGLLAKEESSPVAKTEKRQ